MTTKKQILAQTQDSKAISSAEFDESKFNEETILALVNKLHVIQNYQQVFNHKMANSTSNFTDEKAEKLKQNQIDKIHVVIVAAATFIIFFSTLEFCCFWETSSVIFTEIFVQIYALLTTTFVYRRSSAQTRAKLHFNSVPTSQTATEILLWNSANRYGSTIRSACESAKCYFAVWRMSLRQVLGSETA